MAYALVTGATSGIGLALARQLARKRYNLVLASRDLDKMQELKSELRNLDVVCVQVDLSNPGSARELYEQCQELEVEVVICNAGFGRIGQHLDLPLAEVSGMAHLNMTSLVELCTLFGAPMRHRRQGYLMTVASIAGFFPIPYFAEYAATKAFVVTFSQGLAEELRPHGVKVSCLCPGPTATNFQTRADRPPDYSPSRAMSADDVARAGLEGMWKGKSIVIPGGPRNQLISFLGRLVPPSVVAAYFRRHLKEGQD